MSDYLQAPDRSELAVSEAEWPTPPYGVMTAPAKPGKTAAALYSTIRLALHAPVLLITASESRAAVLARLARLTDALGLSADERSTVREDVLVWDLCGVSFAEVVLVRVPKVNHFRGIGVSPRLIRTGKVRRVFMMRENELIDIINELLWDDPKAGPEAIARRAVACAECVGGVVDLDAALRLVREMQEVLEVFEVAERHECVTISTVR